MWVSKDQHSVAIGRGGQNVRLASKLTGYEIDFVEAEEIGDLDEALARAAGTEEGVRVSEEAKAKFESLFVDSEEKTEE